MRRVQSPIQVGRAAELAVLEAALQDAIAGTLALVVVAGEAGIGKTRLVEEFLGRNVAATRVRAAIGGCLDVGGGGVPYAPYLELLRSLRRSLASDGATAIFERAAPGLAPLVGGSMEPSAEDVDIRRSRLFGRVVDLLHETVTLGPIVLVIEDVHWADRSSLELTGFLVRNLRKSPVLLVVTSRSEERSLDPGREELVAELVREPATRRIDLERLDRDLIRTQMEAITGVPVSDEVATSVHMRSGGNPYLAEELIALAVDGDIAGIPTGPRDIVLARFATLTLAAERLVAAAAVGGAAVDLARLRTVVEVAPDAFDAAIDDALRTALLVQAPDERGDLVAFRHALGREAVLADLLSTERRLWHERWADALAAEGDTTTAGEIARHWDLAGRPDRALPFYLLEAQHASSSLAFDAAAMAYERAIELVDANAAGAEPESRTRGAILGRAAEAMRLSGRQIEAIALIERQVAILPPDDVQAQAAALERLGTCRTEVGDNEGAIEATGHAVALLRGGPSGPLARALISHVMCRVHVLRLEGTLESTDEAIRLAQDDDLRALESVAWSQRGLIRTWVGEIDGGQADLDRAWSLAIGSGDTDAILLAALNRPIPDDARGRLEPALARCIEGIDLARVTGAMHSFEALTLLGNAAGLTMALGRWGEADRFLDEADVMDSAGRARHGTASQRARLAYGRGDLDEARAQLARPELAHGPQTDADHGTCVALVARSDHRPVDALRTLTATLDRAAPIGTFLGLRQRGEMASIGLGAAVDLASTTGRSSRDTDVERMVATLVGALEGAARAHGQAIEPLSRAWLVQVEADLAWYEGRSASWLWADAVQHWEAIGMPEHEGWARLHEAASIVVDRGSRTSARRTLQQARALAAGLGARRMATEVESLAHRARLLEDERASPGTDRPKEHRPYDLTSRELDVLGLMIDGSTNREIAAALFISPKTAGVHVSNVLGKLGVSGRVEAATFALREGLVDK